jgi:6-pyruvoyltetrahydropterin/6-carboxytetrahydropterin synthase
MELKKLDKPGGRELFRISVEHHFDAAHALRGYGGKCENLHGHRFRVVVAVEAQRLDERGLAYDFVELRKHLGEITEGFDHTSLGDIPPFDKLNPSSENIALTIYRELGQRLEQAPVSIAFVEVWESPESCARFTPA